MYNESSHYKTFLVYFVHVFIAFIIIKQSSNHVHDVHRYKVKIKKTLCACIALVPVFYIRGCTYLHFSIWHTKLLCVHMFIYIYHNIDVRAVLFEMHCTCEINDCKVLFYTNLVLLIYCYWELVNSMLIEWLQEIQHSLMLCQSNLSGRGMPFGGFYCNSLWIRIYNRNTSADTMPPSKK